MITATNIEKSYHGERVLFGISLDIADGEFLSIMGESGSGKSTLLSILGGFLASDGGTVLLDGEDISKMSEARLAQIRCTKLGFVFQSYRLIPTLTVEDNLLLPALLGGKKESDLRPYLEILLQDLDILALLDKFPDQLSGGQAQRVAIARALLYQPKTLILDEPTGALDSAMERQVMELLTRIHRERGMTIIQVTHSKTVAEYASRIVYLQDGKIL